MARRVEMLVLSRFVGETIVIGDDIKITVISRKGNSVKFGITAPNGTSVHREEIYNRIRDQAKEGSHEK